MNDLIVTNQYLTISTREIAKLLNKEHTNIKISAERLTEKGVISTLATQEFEHNGNTYTEYLLSIPIGGYAGLLASSGYEIEPNQLVTWLHDKGYFCSQKIN